MHILVNLIRGDLLKTNADIQQEQAILMIPVTVENLEPMAILCLPTLNINECHVPQRRVVNSCYAN